MLQKKGIKYKILLNSFISILIFSIFLVWLSFTYWNLLLNSKKEKLQSIVEVASTVVKFYTDEEKKGTINKQEAQKRAKADINAIRYSGNEYVFITNSKAYQVLNPVKPELSGKDMSEFKDPTGLKLYVEIAKVAVASGKGYIEYMFPKAGSTIPTKKISYVNYFPEWDWIVGTGLYIDDAYAALYYFIEILLIDCFICVVCLVIIGILFASSVQKPLNEVCQSLLKSSIELQEKSIVLQESSSRVKNYSKEQESSIQMTAAAISQITSMIGKTTELTTQSAKLANDISQKAGEGEISMKNMITSMQAIYEASSKLKEIESIINQIESKAQVITEIVAKTELLSLNASIEAARAGEHGKGFSVVAEEVGNLAHTSGKSSDEIRTLLQQSREHVQKILQETLSRISDGQNRTAKVSESFINIVEGIKSINQQMGQISDATKEQEIGVKQIANAMGQLDQLALKNTTESEKSLEVTNVIQNESNNLKVVVEKTESVVFGLRKKHTS